MSRIKEIRERLGLTQGALADALGMTQGNVGHLERGQTLMPDDAGKLADLAAAKGLTLTLDQIYGRTSLPAKRTAKVA